MLQIRTDINARFALDFYWGFANASDGGRFVYIFIWIHISKDRTEVYFRQHRFNKPMGQVPPYWTHRSANWWAAKPQGAEQVNLTSGIFWAAASKAIPTK